MKRPSSLVPSSSPEWGGGYLSQLLDVFRLQAEAWRTERVTEAELRILHSQKRLLEGRQDLLQSELKARLHLTTLLREAEEEEAQLSFHRTLRAASSEQARYILQSEIETERLLGEREHLRSLRRSGSPPPPLPSSHPEVRALPGAALETDVSNTQIESLALRAVTRFSQMAASEAEHAWTQWRDELARRFPAYAVEEIVRRVTEMRGLL